MKAKGILPGSQEEADEEDDESAPMIVSVPFIDDCELDKVKQTRELLMNPDIQRALGIKTPIMKR